MQARSSTAIIEISSERFLMRTLTTGDVTERYLNWLSDAQTQQFIATAARTTTLSDLRQYVCERIGRDDVLFLGIFDKISGLHIGNIKYEPVDSIRGYAIMGILIGDVNFRGKGAAAEVVSASARWLEARRNIRHIVLGVEKTNRNAIRAYKKAGFIAADTPYLQKPLPGTITMFWDLSIRSEGKYCSGV